MEELKLHSSDSKVANQNANSGDFLSRFLNVSASQPEFMHPGRVLGLTATNLFAGSDMTAITLRTIFYYLLRDETTMEKLMAELKLLQNPEVSIDDMPLPTWKDVHGLPYLSAAFKEALRIHPAVGTTLE